MLYDFIADHLKSKERYYTDDGVEECNCRNKSNFQAVPVHICRDTPGKVGRLA
jgi:hypothetical protein